MSCPSLRAAPAALSQATPACRGRAAARCGAFVVQRPAVQAQRRATTAAAARRRQLVVAAAASAPSATTPHVQLATAKLPAGVDATRFKESLFQWAGELAATVLALLRRHVLLGGRLVSARAAHPRPSPPPCRSQPR